MGERSMRIIFFSNTYRPTISGVVTSIDLFRRGLIGAGHDVHIVAPERGDYVDDVPYVFRVPALDLPEPLDLSLAMPLKSWVGLTVRGIKPTVIHSQHPVWIGDLAAAFAQELDVPLVFTFHSQYDAYTQQYVPLVPRLAGILVEEIVQRYLKKCAHVVAPTPAIRDFILRRYAPKAPVSVVPTPVELDAYAGLSRWRARARLGLGDAETLLFVGRLAVEKNVDFLLRAFARVLNARPRARLLLVGDGMAARSTRRAAEALGLHEQVIYVGRVLHREVPLYAAASDVFVFASVTETQGLVLLEAMAAGTPIVAVEAPATAYVLAEGGGVLVPQDEDTFAQAVVALLSDDARRRALGAEAREAAQRYGMADVTRRLLAVYDQVASG